MSLRFFIYLIMDHAFFIVTSGTYHSQGGQRLTYIIVGVLTSELTPYKINQARIHIVVFREIVSSSFSNVVFTCIIYVLSAHVSNLKITVFVKYSDVRKNN